MAAAFFVVAGLLFLVASFGVGFIINMLAKRFPWTSTVIALVLGVTLGLRGDSIGMKLLFSLPIIVGGLVATLVIRTLQRRGFQMFQTK